MVAGEGLETLLALVGLDLGSAQAALTPQLHRRLGHQVLGAIEIQVTVSFGQIVIQRSKTHCPQELMYR
jgi:hypothetical protein